MDIEKERVNIIDIGSALFDKKVIKNKECDHNFVEKMSNNIPDYFQILMNCEHSYLFMDNPLSLFYLNWMIMYLYNHKYNIVYYFHCCCNCI